MLTSTWFDSCLAKNNIESGWVVFFLMHPNKVRKHLWGTIPNKIKIPVYYFIAFAKSMKYEKNCWS